MIPLGLKETKEIDFRDPFKDFVLEHYSEDANKYEDAIADFMDTRQAMRTPLRDNNGIALLFRYYNQLYFVERRFFPPDRSLGIYFEWFDSLTGTFKGTNDILTYLEIFFNFNRKRKSHEPYKKRQIFHKSINKKF